MAKYTRRYLLLNITFVGMESRFSQWRAALVDRLCNLPSQCVPLEKGIKALVLCLHWIRSVLAYINSVLDGPMATVDRQEQEPQDAVPACDWCRMGLHKKCVKSKLHGFCVCDCERGY